MAKPKSALEFKGRTLSLTRLRVLDDDPEAAQVQIEKFARQLGPAAAGMPVLIEGEKPLDLAPLVAALRSVGVQPLAVVEGVLNHAAQAVGLPVIPADLLTESVSRGAVAEASAVQVPSLPAGSARRPTRIVTEPVRSGQQIYAEGGDLILLNAVSVGAEVIADGCVHVYAKLAGRAIAGAKGDESARIFCKRMEAELLAVAGTYAVADQIQGALRGKPAQAMLMNGKLVIEKLDW